VQWARLGRSDQNTLHCNELNTFPSTFSAGGTRRGRWAEPSASAEQAGKLLSILGEKGLRPGQEGYEEGFPGPDGKMCAARAARDAGARG
jgi:hypothetical protein